MELRFLPNSLASVQQQQQNHQQHQQQQQQNNNSMTSPASILSPSTNNVNNELLHRRTLDRSNRNLQYLHTSNDLINKSSIMHNNLDGTDDIGRVTSMRRTRRAGGGGVGGGGGTELLHNRSPMPGKRNRLGSRTENMSSGSLNSIEV